MDVETLRFRSVGGDTKLTVTQNHLQNIVQTMLGQNLLLCKGGFIASCLLGHCESKSLRLGWLARVS